MANLRHLDKALAVLGVTSTWSCEDSNAVTDAELQEVCGNASSPISLADLKQAVANAESAEPMQQLRAERDAKLAATDWWVLPDRNPTQAQLDYRQALRDITQTYTSLDDVVWPEKPEA